MYDVLCQIQSLQGLEIGHFGNVFLGFLDEALQIRELVIAPRLEVVIAELVDSLVVLDNRGIFGHDREGLAIVVVQESRCGTS